MIAFPEGTTWCGRAFGRFRPALFQSAIDAQRPVLPLSVDYLDAAGDGTTVPAFVGADTIGASMRRVLRARGLRVRVTAGRCSTPAAIGASSRTAARDRCGTAPGRRSTGSWRGSTSRTTRKLRDCGLRPNGDCGRRAILVGS